MFDEGYITLEHLSGRLNLPEKFLRTLAMKGVIPSLNVNGRLRFSEQQVRDALDREAAGERTHEADSA
jgi:hypothetical protein